MPERSSVLSLSAILTICICLVALFSADGECHHTVSIVMTLDEAKFGRMSEVEQLEAAKAIAERHNMTVKRQFLTNRFFIEHSGDANNRSVALEALRNVDGVTSIIEERMSERERIADRQLWSKRHGLVAPHRQKEQKKPQKHHREITDLPFPDPQIYFVL